MMSSRKPVIRAYSANGRIGGINEDDLPEPSARPDSRNYLLNVRPESRSTLCSVMAQLTEETQPSFTTTLKSRAVSVDSNVKFTCEVSGYPVPDMTWYKDDMQMDRYCGLPKYEIFRHGKVHTLQIYNCTVDDAAIYQASAKNPKGIVACSCVLEVGSMNEFKIHQQFLSKLKHKADTKRKELEESRRRDRGKENVQATIPQLLQTISPKPPPRKRRSPSEPGLIRAASAPPFKEPEVKTRAQAEARLRERAREDVTVKPPLPTGILNGFATDDRATARSGLAKDSEQANDNPDVTYAYDTVEIVTTTTRRPAKEALAKKRPKISNGVASGEVGGGLEKRKDMRKGDEGKEGGSKRDEAEEGGMSLAQYLAESLKSQESQNKRTSEQEAMEVDVKVSPKKEKEKVAHKKEPRKEVKSDTQTPTSKHSEPTQGPLSAVFFSIRDMFFGSKNTDASETVDGAPQDNHVTTAEKEPPSVPLQPDSNVHKRELGGQAEDFKKPVEKIVPMDTEEQGETPPKGAGLRGICPKPAITRQVRDDAPIEGRPVMDTQGQGGTVPKRPTPVVEEPVQKAKVAAPFNRKPGGGQTQTREASGARQMVETTHVPTKPPVSERVAKDHMQTEKNVASVVHGVVTPVREPDVQVPGVFTSAGGQAATDMGETDTLRDRDQTHPSKPVSSAPPHSRRSGEVSMETKADQQKLGLKNTGAPEQQDLPTVSRDGPKDGVKHVKKKGAESRDVKSQVKPLTLVEDSVAIRGKGSTLSTTQKMETETISETEEKWNKDAADKMTTVQPMSVEIKLPDVSELKEAVAGVPEVKIPAIPDALNTVTPHLISPSLECIVPELPQQEGTAVNVPNIQLTPPGLECIVPELPQEEGTSMNVPQICILESPTEHEPVYAKSCPRLPSTKAVDRAIVESDPASIVKNIRGKDAISTQLVSQQDQEQAVPKEKATQKKPGKAEKETTIPVINVCFSDDSEIWYVPEPHKVKYPMEPEVEEPFETPAIVVPPISVTSAEGLPEINKISDEEAKKIESIPSFKGKHPMKPEVEEPFEAPAIVVPPISVTSTESLPEMNKISEDEAKKIESIPSFKVKYPMEPEMEEPFEAPAVVVPPISVTSTESLPEMNKISEDDAKKIESIPSFVQAISENVDLQERGESPLGDEKDISPPISVCEKITDVKEPDMPLVTGVPPETIVFNQLNTTDLSTSVSDAFIEKTPPLIIGFDHGQGKPEKEPQTIVEPQTFVDQLQKDNLAVEKPSLVDPEQPMLSSTSKGVSGLEVPGLIAVPAIQVDNSPSAEEQADEGTGADSPPSIPSCETSPRLRRKDSPTLIPSATPEELASGARRKIFVPKSNEGAEKEELQRGKSLTPEQEQPYMSPTQPRKASLLQTPTGQQTPPTERRSPLLGRKKATLEVPKRPEEVVGETDPAKTDAKPTEKDTLNPFKAPQVIRKIRGEPFPDAVGHLKLWCQFFNVLSDSIIKWHRDDVEIAEVQRSAGDESQVALALVQTSTRDCGVYGCTMKNEYGSDTTDFLLSADILYNFYLREDLEVGEEIEMTPMIFTKGLAEPGFWGDKFFGRIMIEEAHLGEGCFHKACRVKVIYGLEPVFESGSTCIIKVRSPVAYSSKDESSLAERNLEITKQECKIQNTAREYCKVFAAEARTIENFGTSLEMLPRYLMYRPANTIPYATVEVDVPGVFQKYCTMDVTGRMTMRSSTEMEQKCCAFQHWIHQWTSGHILITQLEGVGTRITNVSVATKSKGYQGLPDCWNPQAFEQFVAQHQCNYYCGLLGLRTLKPPDSQTQSGKIKSSRSPLLNRRGGPGASPQLPKKGLHSPQSGRKSGTSPKVPRKADSGDNGKTAAKPKTAETPQVIGTR